MGIPKKLRVRAQLMWLRFYTWCAFHGLYDPWKLPDYRPFRHHSTVTSWVMDLRRHSGWKEGWFTQEQVWSWHRLLSTRRAKGVNVTAHFNEILPGPGAGSGGGGGIPSKIVIGTWYRTVGLTVASGAYYTYDLFGNKHSTTCAQVFGDMNANGNAGAPVFTAIWLPNNNVYPVDAVGIIKNPNSTILGSGQGATTFQQAVGAVGAIFAWDNVGVTAGSWNVTHNCTNLEIREFTLDFTNVGHPLVTTNGSEASPLTYTHGTTGATPATTEAIVAVIPNGATITAVKVAALGGALGTNGPLGPSTAGGWTHSSAALNQTPTNPFALFMQMTDALQLTFSAGHPSIYYYPCQGLQLLRFADNTAPLMIEGINTTGNVTNPFNTFGAGSIPWIGYCFAPIITMGMQEVSFKMVQVNIGGFLVTEAQGGSVRVYESTLAGWMHDGKSDMISGSNIGNNGTYNANYSGSKNTLSEIGTHHDGPQDGTFQGGGPVYCYNAEKNLANFATINTGELNASQPFQTDGSHAPTQTGFVGGENAAFFNVEFHGSPTLGIGGLTAPIPFFQAPATGIVLGTGVRSYDQTAAQLFPNNSLVAAAVDITVRQGVSNNSLLRIRTNWMEALTLVTGATYNILKTDETILVDATAQAVTVTLPSPSQVSGLPTKNGAGKVYTIIKIDSSANAVTVNANTNGGTIEGANTISLTTQYKKCRLIAGFAHSATPPAENSLWYDTTIGGV